MKPHCEDIASIRTFSNEGNAPIVIDSQHTENKPQAPRQSDSRHLVGGLSSPGHDGASARSEASEVNRNVALRQGFTPKSSGGFESRAIVHIVDDDRAMCTALMRVLNLVGYAVQVYNSPSAFLEADIGSNAAPACLLLDMQLLGACGLDLQYALKQRGCAIPIIFISGYRDIANVVSAMKMGARDFLLKPLETDALISAIREAISGASLQSEVLQNHAKIRLDEREAVVLRGIVSGRLNKQMAADLCLSERTIKTCRAALMRKFGARTAAELIRIATLSQLAEH